MVAYRSRRPGVRPPMSDKAVAALIAKIGAGRLLDMLDKITAPEVLAWSLRRLLWPPRQLRQAAFFPRGSWRA